MSENLDLENTVKPFLKGSSFGLVLCSWILFFIHYKLNNYFTFEVPSWITFVFWMYLIGNSIALFYYLRKNIFECPTCKRRYKRKDENKKKF
ncbi:hypothetical protein M0R72_03870 [Candidatus Pacearchaeota archaeon]|jgi:hypothetical protein|nr:hypothetical protein [Candidatus Pacearchaeota archaeon]